jgi:PPIC-type PPIASE domain
MRRLFHEPLLHFLLLGALLFAVYGRLHGTAETPSEIVVDANRVASLTAQFERTWQRPPTPGELEGLIQSFVREDILYREGLAMGLDRNDPVVRRRVAQKVSFLMDGLTASEPTEQELQAWLDEHAADYAVEPRYDLRQVYFDPAVRGAALERDVAEARTLLERSDGRPPSKIGDPTLLSPEMQGVRAAELESMFGPDFARTLATLPTGTWRGPIRSGYGAHLVLISAREEARAPKLGEVRAQVERDLMRARTERISEEFYQKLRSRYTVRIAAPANQADSVTAAAP